MSKPENCIATTPYHKISLCSVHCNIPTVVRIEVNERKNKIKALHTKIARALALLNFVLFAFLFCFMDFQ